MEGTTDNATANQGLYPRTLPDDCFRLLKWTGDSSKLSFRLIEFAIDQAPAYNALSYRCENVNPDRRTVVTCNDIEILVGQNLYEALLQVQKLKDRCEFIWIDAICIEQHDQLEKQRHIMRMAQVYSKAQVVIWLGPDSHQKTWDFFLWIVTIFQAIDEGTETPEQRQSYEQLLFILDHTPHAKFEEVWNLFQQEWFARVWTLQEAALSTDAIVLNGDRRFPYSLLLHFAETYISGQTHWVKLVSAIRPVSAGNDPKNPPRPLMLHLKAVLKMRKKTNTIRLLDYVRPLACTDPRDRIFSLAAALPVELIQQLRGRVTTPDVYTLYARIESSTDCIAAAGLCQQNLDLPSWVPDWTYRKTNEPLWALDVDAFESRGQRLFQASIEQAEIVITDEAMVKGTVLDDISKVGEPYRVIQLPAGFDVHETPELLLSHLEDSKQQIDEYIKLGSSHARSFDIRKALIGGMAPEKPTETYAGVWIKTTSQQVDEAFQDIEDQVEDLKEYCKSKISKPRPKRLNGLLCIATMCKGRTFFVTKAGWIGLGPAMLAEGDKVCIFNGARTPSIIRRAASTSTSTIRYQLVGECYVSGLMDGEVASVPGLRHENICLV